MKLQQEGLRWEPRRDRPRLSLGDGMRGDEAGGTVSFAAYANDKTRVGGVQCWCAPASAGERTPGPCLRLHASPTHSVYCIVRDLSDAQTTLGRATITSVKTCLICAIINDFKYHDT